MDFNKIPEVVDSVVKNGEKAADTYEKRPTGSFVYIILVLCICITIYFGWQNNKLEEKLQAYGQASFQQAMQNNAQKKVIAIQDTVIRKATTYIKDSIKAKNH